MVADRADRLTLTAAEAAVMRHLLEHPDDAVETGPRTEVYRRRSFIAPMADPHDVVAVELKATRRLVKAGLVRVDAGGYAHLTDEGRKAAEAPTE